MLIKKIFSYLLSVFAISFLLEPLDVSAMIISPVRFEIAGDPGETILKEMIINNDENAAQSLYSSFANFEAQGETGSASFVDPVEGIGTWMQTDTSVYLLPGEQKKVNIIIRIPDNAEPGGHFGVIFWGNSPDNPQLGQQLSVGAKSGLLVLLTVNGDVKEGGGLLSFGTKDDKFWYNTLPVSFEYRFRNDGSDRIKPSGKIKLRSFAFIPAGFIDANSVNGNILPNSTRKYSVDWQKYSKPKDFVEPSGTINKFFSDAKYQWKNFALGLYKAKLDLTYGTQNNQADESVLFFVFPWQLIICLIFIFTAVSFVGKKLIHRYNRHIIKKAQIYRN
jgi:hypothetical protein